MSFNGTGTFVINSSGQPVVSSTVISATVFNALTADLATGLSTCITKDGQTTPTNNIPMGGFKITGLGAGTVGTDAVRLSQLQAGTAQLLAVSGTDTLTALGTPTLTAYATGNTFYFVAAATNTTSVTLNVDGLGAKAVTRHGSTALVAGDILVGEVCLVVYDGTRFQLLNPTSYTNLNVSGVLSLAAGAVGTPSLASSGDLNTGLFFPAADTIAASVGGVEGWRLTSAGLGIGTTSPGGKIDAITGTARWRISNDGSGNIINEVLDSTGAAYRDYKLYGLNLISYTSGTERMRLDSSGNLGIGTSSPGTRLHTNKSSQTPGDVTPSGAFLVSNISAGSGCVEIGSGSSVLGYLQVRNSASQTYYDFALQPNGGNVGIGTSLPAFRLDVLTGVEGDSIRLNNNNANIGAANTFGFVVAESGSARVNLRYRRDGSGSAELYNVSNGPFVFGTNNTERARIDANGNIVAGASAALATTATNGFLYVPTCAGTPTGTPTAITGMAPIVVNTTNNKLYFYSGGAWRDAGP